MLPLSSSFINSNCFSRCDYHFEGHGKDVNELQFLAFNSDSWLEPSALPFWVDLSESTVFNKVNQFLKLEKYSLTLLAYKFSPMAPGGHFPMLASTSPSLESSGHSSSTSTSPAPYSSLPHGSAFLYPWT